ncbi:QWRF motif-containing protein 3-like [Helianthus annuus]|uniref:QWRF motif-containing protein 3-like n=1 Tax=Helianthus annuus TaxID=4232 RepID=UPI001652D165|nr:QWRF motif-containing protein 3-like [Helianthus annuus]
MDPQATTISLRHGIHLVESAMPMASSFMPTSDETASIFSELAKVAIEERLLLDECFEHIRVISTLEVEERSLRCNLIEMTLYEAQGL